MKNLIVKAFKDILHLDVRVINLPDEDIDMAIFIIKDKRIKKMSDNELSKYSYDYAITRVDNRDKSLWLYIKSYEIDGITRNGEVVSPPDFDYVESVMTYKTAELALRELIVEQVKEVFNDLLQFQEELVNRC